MPYRWDASLGRYRDAASGRLVAEGRVRLAIDAVADAASDRLADLTERLVRGDISLARWQAESMRVIKVSHVASGVAAAGGKAQMGPSEYGFLGSEIRAQYAYLRGFAGQIASGAVPLDGRLIARAGMYGQHARVTYEAVRAKDARRYGYVQERNVLHANESCGQCRHLASLGWVDVGALPPIGSRTCLARCRCTITRRKEIAVAQPAPALAVA